MMNAAEPTDEHLVMQYQQSGDTRVLDRLFRRHMARVRTMAYAMVLNDTDADDLAQEIFVRAARSVHQFEGRALFSTWLHRIAQNCAHRFLQRRGTRRALHVDAETDGPAPIHQQPDRTLAADELDGAVRDALARLSTTLRAAIVLVVIQEMPVREAARAAGCSTPTLYWRVHQARRQLRVLLREYVA